MDDKSLHAAISGPEGAKSSLEDSGTASASEWRSLFHLVGLDLYPGPLTPRK